LRIARAGARRLDEPVAGLGAPGERPAELLVRDLDADGEPEVVLDLFTGGAHCCTESRIYRYAPGPRTYRRSLQGWGNAGYRSTDLDRDGRPELQSADDRFSYLFTSYAGSFRPIQIWHFERGRLLDVTRSFPGAVADDATAQWREYKRLRAQRSDVRGVLAAWLADMIVLGREGKAWRQLERAYALGELGPRKELAGWPQGTRLPQVSSGALGQARLSG
jgi:hypothetical protein